MDGKTAGDSTFTIDPIACEGCGVCVQLCPAKAIDFPERSCGWWFISETRFGPMVHAQLSIAAENSGKLVSTVRREARRIADDRRSDWILVDGPPGVGCPVIASITGASAVLAVTEPSLSGEHDLERVLALARHFNVPTAVCVNKWDINAEITGHIEQTAATLGAFVTSRIPYDRSITDAQVNGKTVVEFGDGPAATSIRQIWEEICKTVS